MSRQDTAPTSAQAEAVAHVWRSELAGRPVRPSSPAVRATSRTSKDGSRGSRPRGSIRPDVQRRIVAAGWIALGTVRGPDGRDRPSWVTTADGRAMVEGFDFGE